MVDRTQRRVYDLLHRIPADGLAAVKRLFCTELNYAHANQTISSRGWPDAAQEALGGSPVILARHASQFGHFDILHVPLCAAYRGTTFPLSVTAERLVINQLLKDHPYTLFIFSDADQRHWHLVNVRYDEDEGRRRIFRRITIGPHERLRTASERVSLLDLASLTSDLFALSPIAIQHRHDEAFDVEAVTKAFFGDYARHFGSAEAQIEGLKGKALRLFTQLLFNRLLFITFLERKGWLTLDGRADYLCALWEAHKADGGPEENFYRDRLELLFFSGLNNISNVDMMRINEGGFLADRIGRVPYLNGGLFEKEALDRHEGVTVPDEVFGPIIDDLIYHYNFTVTESTPLDIEVAVDPEMLGRIFEELVTGRHETGSYYTPKAVVSFMCREALKGYLQDTCPGEDTGVVGAFVEQHDASRIRQPEAVLAALQRVRVCDHACGSGAYLVGMLHELIDLRQALFKAQGVDARAVYDKKLEIIQRNLYGVDIDPFAVNIARLRLWLSLTVDFEGEVPPPLPNLEFKIEVGDSLTGPAPGQLQPDLFHHQQVQEYFRVKGEFMRAHGPEKAELRRRIEGLQRDIAAWASEGDGEGNGFDWAVVFAEVFAGPAWDTSTMMGAMTDMVNTTPGQMELAEPKGTASGFDIVLTNPPYVRHELVDSSLKEVLSKRYSEVYTGMADLYVYFYARALHLLRKGGVGSFISSNKWLRAGYGKKLRRHLATQARVRTIVDFGDLPLFEATAYPLIVIFENETPRAGTAVQALEVTDISTVHQLSKAVVKEAWDQPQSSLVGTEWTLVRPRVFALLRKLRQTGTPLGEYTRGQFYTGIKTGLNRAFVIDASVRSKMLGKNPECARHIKPWLRGKDVKRWRVSPPNQYLIYVPWEFDLADAPAIREHLELFRDRLTVRPEVRDGRHPWYALSRYAANYAAEFDRTKIVWPDIAKRCEFALDEKRCYPDMTLFTLPGRDYYLLGVLNSSVVEWFLRHIGPTIQHGFLRFKSLYVERFPIPLATEIQRYEAEALVKKLLDAEGKGPHVPEWERELNALVYKIYGLTKDEIAIIERETTMDG